MKYLLFKYTSPIQNQRINLGDYIQTIAVREALKRIGIHSSDFIYYDRDALSYYESDECICVMNGWFSHTLTWMPSKKIKPVYFGTHFINEIRHHITHNKQALDTLRPYKIGARDVLTQKILSSLGLETFYSRCLSLTLPRTREPGRATGKVFVVDVPDPLYSLIPHKLTQGAVRLGQRAIKEAEGNKFSQNRFYAQAEARLELYKNEAGLIITSALHCAAPCMAIGIPVVFLMPYPMGSDPYWRVSLLADFMPLYTRDDIAEGKVEWTPKESPDMENLKIEMLGNLKNMINDTLHN